MRKNKCFIIFSDNICKKERILAFLGQTKAILEKKTKKIDHFLKKTAKKFGSRK